MAFRLATTHKNISLNNAYWRLNGFAWHRDGGERIEISITLFPTQAAANAGSPQELAAFGIRGPALSVILALLQAGETDYRAALYRWLKQREPEQPGDPDFRTAVDI